MPHLLEIVARPLILRFFEKIQARTDLCETFILGTEFLNRFEKVRSFEEARTVTFHFFFCLEGWLWSRVKTI